MHRNPGYKRRSGTKWKTDIDSRNIGCRLQHLSLKNRTKQKITKEIEDLNNTVDWLKLADTQPALYSIMAQCIFFSSAYETLFVKDHILGHKICVNKYKKIESYKVFFLKTIHETRNEEQEKNW